MILKRLVLAAVTLAATAMPAMAGEGKFSGLVFGDAYWMAANHDSTIEDMNGVWIRRVYLTWDQTFNDTYSARVRLEAAQPGDFTTNPTIPAFVKDAWLRWKKNGHAALIGVQPTPSITLYEDTWGYRAVEKAPLDLQGLGGTRDGGISVMGDVGETKVFGYHVMVGNGTSVGAETNSKKKAMASIHLRPVEHIVLEVYGDYEDRVGSANRVTWFGFAGYSADRTRAGVQFAQQTRMETGEDIDIRVLSAFFTRAMAEKVWLLARVDRNMDPNPGGESIAYMPFAVAENTFFIAGLDFAVTDDVNLIPNAEITVYDDPDGPAEAPDTDVMLRLTFQGKF